MKQGAFGRVEMVKENYEFDEPDDLYIEEVSSDDEQPKEKETGPKVSHI